MSHAVGYCHCGTFHYANEAGHPLIWTPAGIYVAKITEPEKTSPRLRLPAEYAFDIVDVGARSENALRRVGA